MTFLTLKYTYFSSEVSAGQTSSFFDPHSHSQLQPFMSSDRGSMTLIAHEHVLCRSVLGRGESVSDVECGNSPPSVVHWLMFKEWSKSPWPTHLTARGIVLPPHIKVIVSDVLNNYYTQLWSLVCRMKVSFDLNEMTKSSMFSFSFLT